MGENSKELFVTETLVYKYIEEELNNVFEDLQIIGYDINKFPVLTVDLLVYRIKNRIHR